MKLIEKLISRRQTVKWYSIMAAKTVSMKAHERGLLMIISSTLLQKSKLMFNQLNDF